MSSDEYTTDFLSQKFEQLEKGHREEGDANADADSSSICRLPDEIILQILNKLLDLKTLCCCYLVSKRFSSIVLEVEAISFTVPLLNPNTAGDVPLSRPIISLKLYFQSIPFVSACTFLSKFRGVKSLCIQLPFSSHDRVVDNPRCLFKWKFQFGRRVESAIFLSPNSICDKDGFNFNGIGDEEEDMGLTNDLFEQKNEIFMQCLEDGKACRIMLLYFIMDLATLEKVCITDSWRSARLSLSGAKLSEVKEWLHNSASETEAVAPVISLSRCYIPVLKLPVSGYVMKGVFCSLVERHDLQGGYDGLLNSDDGFEDKEEAAYSEAVKEILGKHKGTMRTFNFANGALV